MKRVKALHCGGIKAEIAETKRKLAELQNRSVSIGSRNGTP